MQRLTNGVRILVADGAHARVLRNEGDAGQPRLTLVRAYDQDNPPTHEQGADKPGRVNDSSGRRSSMETPDYHQIAEDRFIASLAADMERDLARGAYAKLVVVAPPVALGRFRKAISPAVAAAIVLEMDKDYTKHTVADVTRIIAAALE